jgi:hypothetical protein
MNMIFLGLFFEYALFHTLDRPLKIILDFYSRIQYILIRIINGIVRFVDGLVDKITK